MAPETDKPDLAGLRIQRDPPDSYTVEKKRSQAWKYAIPAGTIFILAAVYFLFNGVFPRTFEVDLGVASLTFPSQANAVLTASGYVVAQQKASVASKGTGRLEYLGVEEGDRVKKGQIIARLEDEDVVAALNKARADLEVAQADLNDAQRSLNRQKTLTAAKLGSQADLDAAQARYDRVKATIRSMVAGQQAAEVAVENTRIRAPFDGTVLTKDADVGEVVAPFASSANSRGAVVTMADMNSLQVEADVSESNITRVKVGQPCEIVLDAYPDKRYQGIVHKIVPTADRAKATVMTKVAFLKRDDRVLPEMSAKVTFLNSDSVMTQSDGNAVLTVPASAVTTRGGVDVVFIVRDGKAIESPVRTGRSFGDRREIQAGVAQGDQVVLHPDPGLASGISVKPRAK